MTIELATDDKEVFVPIYLNVKEYILKVNGNIKKYGSNRQKRRAFYHALETTADRLNIRLIYICRHCTCGLLHEASNKWDARRFVELHTRDCLKDDRFNCKNVNCLTPDQFIDCNCADGSDCSSRCSDESVVITVEKNSEEGEEKIKSREISPDWFMSANEFKIIDK